MQSTPILLLSDFDGTIADTFSPSPNRIGVEEAHTRTIVDLFGDNALVAYSKIGGLQNRAPCELITALLAEDLTLTTRAEVSCETPNPTVIDMAREFIERKLKILLAEINPGWPRPCDGFLDFIAMLDELRKLGLAIDWCVITNGHDRFLRKTFDVWGIEHPPVMVTDENVSWLDEPSRLEERVKPAVFPFNLAFRDWQLLGESEAKHRTRAIYIGDDPNKDGGLAANAGVPFGHFVKNGNAVNLSQFPRGSFRFSDWREIGEFLFHNLRDLRAGLPCSSVFENF